MAREVNEVIARKGGRAGRENKVDKDVRKNLGLTFLERRNGGKGSFFGRSYSRGVVCQDVVCGDFGK